MPSNPEREQQTDMYLEHLREAAERNGDPCTCMVCDAMRRRYVDAMFAHQFMGPGKPPLVVLHF
jgi:hypothetical protein